MDDLFGWWLDKNRKYVPNCGFNGDLHQGRKSKINLNKHKEMDDLGLFPSFNTTRDHTRSQKSSARAAEHTIPSQLVHVGITINP